MRVHNRWRELRDGEYGTLQQNRDNTKGIGGITKGETDRNHISVLLSLCFGRENKLNFHLIPF